MLSLVFAFLIDCLLFYKRIYTADIIKVILKINIKQTKTAGTYVSAVF